MRTHPGYEFAGAQLLECAVEMDRAHTDDVAQVFPGQAKTGSAKLYVERSLLPLSEGTGARVTALI